jgi:Lon protease-like protein
LPLHIFEPRYRELLADCRSGDGEFGVILTTGGAERDLPNGHVGCVAGLRDVHVLPDGRANVLVEGLGRFSLQSFVEAPQSYHIARVESYDDLPGDDVIALAEEADRVRETFARVAAAAQAIADESGPLPPLPDEPELLAFRVASLIDFDRKAQQALLASRSPLARLRDVHALLTGAIDGVLARAAAHARAHTNGHGPAA